MSTIERNQSGRKLTVSRLKRQKLPCHLCGYEIDYEAHYLEPRSFAADEFIPASKGGKVSGSNVMPAHRCCNQWRGNRPVTPYLRMQMRARYERQILHKVVRHKAKRIDIEHSQEW